MECGILKSKCCGVQDFARYNACCYIINCACYIYTVNCTVPEDPSNGTTIVNYERLNETVLEGTVLCDNGLSLTVPNTIICTNAGVWNLEPSTIMCVSPTTVREYF